MDLDHFKSINDRFGHPAGDAVLKKVALALRGLASEEFITARIGGEEFAVVLPEHALAQAVRFAERLREGIAGLSLTLPGGPQQVTVSIGAAAWENGMSGTGDLLRAADAQLYRAKQDGRNKVCSALDA